MHIVPTISDLNNSKVVRAWCMYDWANSAYSLVITSAIFPVYYKAVAKNGDSDIVSFFGLPVQNSSLYSYALSFSFLVVAAILPLLSGMADYTGRKKYFMRFFVWLGSLSCMGLFFFTDVSLLWLGLTLSILASIGYSASLVFYDAFLPEIASEDRYDAISARGYSLGYIGSVILMVLCLIMIMNYSSFWFPSEGAATRFSFLLVGMWWIGFSSIPLRMLPETRRHSGSVKTVWSRGYQEIQKVWQALKDQPDLKRYLAAFFFFNSGVQTVMYLATLFGTDVLHLESAKLIATIVLIQLVASVGAWSFARLSKVRGNRFTLVTMIIIWIFVCFTAYFIQNEFQFYGLALIVGLIMGGIQSLSRATYSKLIPEGTIDNTSYFSFYDVTFNLSIVAGTFAFGLINQLTGNMRYSALSLAIFFIVGILLLLRVRSTDILAPRSNIANA